MNNTLKQIRNQIESFRKSYNSIIDILENSQYVEDIIMVSDLHNQNIFNNVTLLK